MVGRAGSAGKRSRATVSSGPSRAWPKKGVKKATPCYSQIPEPRGAATTLETRVTFTAVPTKHMPPPPNHACVCSIEDAHLEAGAAVKVVAKRDEQPRGRRRPAQRLGVQEAQRPVDRFRLQHVGYVAGPTAGQGWEVDLHVGHALVGVLLGGDVDSLR